MAGIAPHHPLATATAPDHMVGGSDWPHVHVHTPMMKTGLLLNLVARWAPDEKTGTRILVDNPAKLYGF